MGGFFGVASKQECMPDLFFGTDYHSHLGTRRGGITVRHSKGYTRSIHDITNAQFRSKFEDELGRLKGAPSGIGVISDYEDQPIIVGSHLGTYAIVTVGVVQNAAALVSRAYRDRTGHFAEMSSGEPNPTELAASLINAGTSFADGIRNAQMAIEGSCSMLLLTDHGIYAARDRLGRTPVIVGTKKGSYAVTMETTAFPNLDVEYVRDLGPGEIVLITPEGIEQKRKPLPRLQICSFLWVYYGYPSSEYEGINVEAVRNRCGAALAKNDDVEIDMASCIPDSGTGHAIGYANEARVPYLRPFVKYTPTWPRSFMPQDQSVRDLVAKMKLIPIRHFIRGKRILFCEDSIVRGTQLKDIIERVYDYGAREIHMRPACPPLLYGCKFLNFSRSRSELDLAGRTAIHEMNGGRKPKLAEFANPCSKKHCAMVERIRKRLKLTSLKYQKLDDLVAAIGLPKSKLCTYCWDGAE
jgi:amidophosphoribosyltransferase